ncbi:MAG: aminotransferase class I/II-fold pyridoxal phosphate-dependent enzyme, partial [Fimbriimonadaceae bacterium]|nr:aminotransferase class I/II-fold pyridoxal phosphate-dependent enzyme [Alphaproteobacteria bacterium]
MTQSEYLRVPYGMTVHGREEIDAVVRVLETSTQMGPHTREFEHLIAQEFSKSRGLMVNSGSSALMLAMEAFDLPQGSEIITPALTFATTVGCILKNGHIPVFVDVGRNDYVMDAGKAERMISDKTRAIVAPNLMGNIVNWTRLRELADRHNLLLLEDSADILGVRYNGKNLG